MIEDMSVVASELTVAILQLLSFPLVFQLPVYLNCNGVESFSFQLFIVIDQSCLTKSAVRHFN